MDNDTNYYEEEFYKIVDAFGGIEAFEKALAEEINIEEDVELPW